MTAGSPSKHLAGRCPRSPQRPGCGAISSPLPKVSIARASGISGKGGPARAEQAPSGRELLAPDQSVAPCEDSPGTMDGGEKQPCNKGEVIDEGADFGLVPRRVRRAVEGGVQERHVDGRQQRCFREERAGQEA